MIAFASVGSMDIIDSTLITPLTRISIITPCEGKPPVAFMCGVFRNAFLRAKMINVLVSSRISALRIPTVPVANAARPASNSLQSCFRASKFNPAVIAAFELKQRPGRQREPSLPLVQSQRAILRALDRHAPASHSVFGTILCRQIALVGGSFFHFGYCLFQNIASNSVDLSLLFRSQEFLAGHQLEVPTAPCLNKRCVIWIAERLVKTSIN